MPALSDVVNYTNDYLRVAAIEDWAHALNGLQIENAGTVTKIGAAVDASSASLSAAAACEIDFLIVHHGLFWRGCQAITGMLYRQIKLAFGKNIALYSAHLPLDVHEKFGNNVLLCRALDLKNTEPFLEMKGRPIGRKANIVLSREELIARLEHSLGVTVQCIGTGPKETETIGVITGAAGSEIYEVARQGVDTFITGEAPHWAAVAAEELGVNLLLGGHYATETFGVKELAAHLADRFEIPWEFIDHPTGL